MATSTAKKKAAPAITIPPLKKGELYVGAIINPDGTGHHVILLPGDGDKLTHPAALEWAKKQGGDLPDRVEQAMLWKHLKSKFKKVIYWSSEPYAGDDAYAWCQGFYGGTQGTWHKDDEFRARAVRRIVIE